MHPALLALFPLFLGALAHKEATTPEEKEIQRSLRNAAYHVRHTDLVWVP
jgi:hypothetical protein